MKTLEDWDDILDAHFLPLHEQLLNRLADLLMATEYSLEIVRRENALSTVAWAEPEIQGVYDTINGLMKKLSD